MGRGAAPRGRRLRRARRRAVASHQAAADRRGPASAPAGSCAAPRGRRRRRRERLRSVERRRKRLRGIERRRDVGVERRRERLRGFERRRDVDIVGTPRPLRYVLMQ